MTLRIPSFNSLRTAMTAVAATLASIFASGSLAAPINYGDFSDIPPGAVMYLDVTETANSPDDEEPLFGPPNITGDQLEFDPTDRFRATASGGTADLADGSVRFITDSIDPIFSRIDVVLISSFSVSGTGGDTTAVDATLGITGISVLEIDGNPVASPILLPDLTASNAYDLSAGPAIDAPWEIDLQYDVNAALAAAGIPFQFGATMLSYGVDVALGASSEANTDAMIVAEHLSMNTVVGRIPEPGSIVLACVALCVCVVARRCSQSHG